MEDASQYVWNKQNNEVSIIRKEVTGRNNGNSWANIAKLPTTAENNAGINNNSPPPQQQQQEPPNNEKQIIPCRFFTSPTGCRNGNHCAFAHITIDTTGDEDQSSCGICLERLNFQTNVAMLQNCTHVFCWTCLHKWRKGEFSNFADTVKVSRSCPVCRSESFFMIPTSKVPGTAEEKAAIVKAYKERCKSIPCRFVKDCPFGTSCFYKHENIQQQGETIRFLKSADLQTTSLQKRFEDFLIDAKKE